MSRFIVHTSIVDTSYECPVCGAESIIHVGGLEEVNYDPRNKHRELRRDVDIERGCDHVEQFEIENWLEDA